MVTHWVRAALGETTVTEFRRGGHGLVAQRRHRPGGRPVWLRAVLARRRPRPQPQRRQLVPGLPRHAPLPDCVGLV